MRPLLKNGDWAELDPVPSDALRPGDILLYRVEDRKRAHRFAFRTRKGLWVFDDAGTLEWHRIKPSAVLGRLRHPSFFSKGLPGLAFGLASSLAFRTARRLAGRVPSEGAA